MNKKLNKTNAVRILDAAKANYGLLSLNLPDDTAVSARQVAEILGKRPEQVFKTLVTIGKSLEHYVFVVPGAAELDLKKAARAVSEKSIEMIKSKELLPLTGYIHGGCSPVGMKKFFTTIIDASANNFDTIIISAGRVGLHLEISLSELGKAIKFSLEDIASRDA
ncbi:MAG: Cys-tRNA(Pro) deacylase [Synergistaceae bacterium]|nr:Cys-tRNA(Pro) deacylase [Synergistaceae bacterium]MBR1417393.1 Cys-tRNA(Pro) deacylase [Synergistaceae bacterium]